MVTNVPDRSYSAPSAANVRVQLTHNELRLLLAVLVCRPSQAPSNAATVASGLVRKLMDAINSE